MQATQTTERPRGAPASSGDDLAVGPAPRATVISQHVTSDGLVTYTRGRDGQVQVWIDRTPQRRSGRR